MLRLVLAFALMQACTVAALAAVETPLTLGIGQGNRVLVIDPAYGSLTIYELSQQNARRISGIGAPQANFITDLDALLKTYVAEQEGVAISALRLGNGTKPLYGEMFTKLMSDKPTATETKAGKKALRWRATAAENAFWKGELAYDGVVRAAVSGNNQYVLLGIPSLHALMLYRIDGEAVLLAGYRNYGPELLMTGFNTSPSPKELLQAVLPRIPKDREEEARKALGIEEEAKAGEAAPAAGAAGAAAEEPPTPKSDLWIGAGSQGTFVVFDIANTRAMLYQSEKLQLVSVRDLKIDLVVPGLVGGSLKSDPAGEDLLKQFQQTRKAHIAKYALPTDLDEILMVVGKRQPKGKTSPFEASSSTVGATMANFVDRRVFLTFELVGGAALNLVGARDYSLDIAVALLDQEILDRERAKDNLSSAGKLAGAGSRASALLTLKQALVLDPTLHKDAEKQFKTAFAKDAAQQAEYQALLDAAAKKAEALAAEIAERKKALEEKRKKPKPQ